MTEKVVGNQTRTKRAGDGASPDGLAGRNGALESCANEGGLSAAGKRPAKQGGTAGDAPVPASGCGRVGREFFGKI